MRTQRAAIAEDEKKKQDAKDNAMIQSQLEESKAKSMKDRADASDTYMESQETAQEIGML